MMVAEVCHILTRRCGQCLYSSTSV
jgi:hypothetical protein